MVEDSTMKTYNCLNCDKLNEWTHQKVNKYCSNKCQGEYTRRTISLPKFEQGLIADRNKLRRILTEQRGYNCEVCNISDWQGEPITLQVDHINGNPGNHKPINLRLICPNCHSQTPYFSGRNRGNGRGSRGLPTN